MLREEIGASQQTEVLGIQNAEAAIVLSTPYSLPTWSGTAYGPLPYESTFSAVLRFAWRNALTEKQLRNLCTDTTFKSLYFGGLQYWFSEQKFAEASGWRLPSEEEQVFAGRARGGSTWLSNITRFCPTCLAHGYHSFLHQLVVLEDCPLHKVRMVNSCCNCGENLPPYQLGRDLFHRRYMCRHCEQPLAGVAPRLSLHLAFRAQVGEIRAAFRPIMEWWVSSSRARESTSIWSYGSGTQNPDREFPWIYEWCNVADLIRSATLHSLASPMYIAAPKYPGVMLLPLRIKVDARRPRHARWNSQRQRIDEQKTPDIVYTAFVRALQRWVLRHHDASELPEPNRLNRVADYPFRALALLCLRWQFEKRWVGTTKWWAVLPILEWIQTPSLFGDHTYNGRIPRLAWRAFFLAHYAAWFHIVQQARYSDVEDLLDRFVMDSDRIKTPRIIGRFTLTDKASRERSWLGEFIFPEVEFLDQVFTPRARRQYRRDRSSGPYPVLSPEMLL